MTIKQLALAACAGTAALAYAVAASAQTPDGAPATPPINYGPPIAGMCTVAVDGAIASSTVGKYVDTRLEQLGAQANAELSAERSAIDAEAKALDGQRSTLDQNTFDQRAASLQVRDNAWQRKAQIRERELQATQQQAVGRVLNEMRPLIAQAAQQKNCAILIDRSAVLLANPAMDLTGTVVTALNAKITQFAFERTHLDQTGAAPPVTETPPQAPSSKRK